MLRYSKNIPYLLNYEGLVDFVLELESLEIYTKPKTTVKLPNQDSLGGGVVNGKRAKDRVCHEHLEVVSVNKTHKFVYFSIDR